MSTEDEEKHLITILPLDKRWITSEEAMKRLSFAETGRAGFYKYLKNTLSKEGVKYSKIRTKIHIDAVSLHMWMLKRS